MISRIERTRRTVKYPDFFVHFTVAFLCFIFISGIIPPSSAGYIRYVEFNPTLPVLRQAMEYDISSHADGAKPDVSWIDLLAYAAAKSGGIFEKKRSAAVDELYALLAEDGKLEEITDGMEFFSYYQKAYGAVLSQYLGWHDIEVYDESAPNNRRVEHKYGLCAFSPIAKGYGFSHYEDFGAARSFGYRRPHLGNDLLGAVGTPIIAVEGGVVEALGWNMYGGWRIGIRSFDGQRYYYYAHLRAKHPYHAGLDEGSVVSAGDVIGYLGMTGYSTKEGASNIETPHLHFGLQLIFDEAQKDGVNQIWVDVYALTELLNENRCSVEKTEDGEYSRVYRFADRSYTQLPDSVSCMADAALSLKPAEPSGADGIPEEAAVPLPVIMYHSVIPESDYWGKYVVPPSVIETDIEYLLARGYTPVSAAELLAYADCGGRLPEKPVLITFDDGYYNNYTYLPEILDKYKAHAIVAPVGKFADLYTEKPEISRFYGVASWPKLKEMTDTGFIELANHSYDQHFSDGLLEGEAFVSDVGKMQSAMLKNLGFPSPVYAYPFGRMPAHGDELVRRCGIRITLTCTEKINYITRDGESLFSLGRFNRPCGISTEDFMRKILG